jgi:hypothetical protein
MKLNCFVCFDSATVAASVAAATSAASALEMVDYIMIFFLDYQLFRWTFGFK